MPQRALSACGNVEKTGLFLWFWPQSARTKEKNVVFYAAAGEKALMRPASTSTAQVLLLKRLRDGDGVIGTERAGNDDPHAVFLPAQQAALLLAATGD
jgi:hypothetical protein